MIKTSPQELNQLIKSFFVGELGGKGALAFIFILVIALLCAFYISTLYVYFFGNRSTGSQVHRSFHLLAISITGIFIAIQFSLPLSLGLLGALSIVRFRTPIKEPEEIGFIMLVVAISIACATFNLLYAGIILVFATLGLFIQKLGPSFLKGSFNHGLILLTLPEKTYQEKSRELLQLLSTTLDRGELDSVTNHNNRFTITYRFYKLSRQKYIELESSLKRLTEDCNLGVYYNRQPVF